MNGDDLLLLAGRLVATPSLGDPEARFRSSVSRSYYGVFHWAVQVLAEFHVRVPKNHTGHEFAYRTLSQTGNGLAKGAASLLNDLRGDRNEADYNLEKDRFSKHANAVLCVECASDAIRDLKRCLEDPARSELETYFGNKPV